MDGRIGCRRLTPRASSRHIARSHDRSRPSTFCSARRAASAPGSCAPSTPSSGRSRRYGAAGLCAPRDRAQQVRRREPEGEGRGVRARARRGPGRPTAPVIFSAHGVPKSVPRRPPARRALRHRRHLPAGHQGAPRGRDPSQARPPHRAGRPCRPSRGRRHHGPAAAGRHHAGRDGRRVASARRAGRRQPRLRDADDALGRRHARDRRGPEGALSGDRRAAQGGHLLRHHQPPGGGEARRAAGRRA